MPRDGRREHKLTTCQGGVPRRCRQEWVLVPGNSWERELGLWCSGRAAGVQEASEGLCADAGRWRERGGTEGTFGRAEPPGEGPASLGARVPVRPEVLH